MSSKGLSCNIFQLVLAGCMTLVVSTPTLASTNQTNQYWSSISVEVSETHSSKNHYASEKNDRVETSQSVQFYRQSPITSQGMHFRASSRNPNFVTFSDSFRRNAVKPMQPAMNKPELRSVLPVKVAPLRYEKPQAGPFVTKQLLSDSSNYHFRTDPPLAVNKAEGGYQTINASSVSENIVNTTVTKKEDNPWDKYTFRPDEPSF